MALNRSEEQLVNRETELGETLPHDYRESMKVENGGEARTEEDDWELYSIKDTSGRKRLARTYNILLKKKSRVLALETFLNIH
ncbi:SMI1/KNR4 family protein [Photobacterium sp. CCB-ST2H9]|uniref:SMI1/KNR4 family protein n=1 Tax=Photobacterium sp. CCB-ST2H9 TaxID=2912855 RepID=UPI0020049A7B|nr:SMI1/KNR4 family protein [Photobacterium sp. CCB-ST2H9]UTM56134.1 SMI1/KNR4 family protein [Photobacterium sp. CCB-ST2H9]